MIFRRAVHSSAPSPTRRAAWRRVARTSARLLGGLLLLVGGPAIAYVFWPLPDGLTVRAAGAGIRLEDRHGLVLRTTRAEDGSLQRWTPLDQIDPNIIAAFIAVEDHRFYRHHGVDLRAILRATRDNLRGVKVVSGASTITMQLARLYFGTPRGWWGKAGQVLQAWRLEIHLDKQTILEQYLNRVPLGQGTVGVPAASLLYFNRSPSQVSLGQAALLAGLARAPSGSNPLVSLERARIRRNVGLVQLRAARYLTVDELERAGEEPLLTPRQGSPFLAPHFTSRILEWEEQRNDPVGDTRRTSLDLPLQQAIEGEVRETVTLLGSSGARDAAAVVLDNATGEILAWVGSPDFWADTAGQVDMVISPRQPGSALKPFVYGLAFDRGYTPASVLPDIARTYATSVGSYRPRNYDRRFHGPVRAREALASSYNVPAVELTNRLSAASLLLTLHDAGFESLSHGSEYYGLGLALGNGDVTLLEMANAYRALANGGVWTPYTWRYGDGTPGHATGSGVPGRRVISARSAALVLDILRDPVARIPGFGLETPFDFPFPVAAKTGTSRHFTDNWAVGTTGNFTVAVWVGDFSGRPMDRVSGITGAGPLLHRAIMLTAQRYAPGMLAGPAETGAVPVTICLLCGMRAGPFCPHQVEWFPTGEAHERECDWHRSGGVVLPALYQEWAEQSGLSKQSYDAGSVASADSASGVFRITSPLDGDRYQVPPGVDGRFATIALRTAGGSARGPVRWTVDGVRVTAARWILQPGAHRFVARSGGEEIDSVKVLVTGD
jgi:penicillin-binding protein 1C